MKTALAIFAKTLELSPVKTRLAANIGEEDAKAFYKLSVSAIEAVAKFAAVENTNIHPHWCIGEEAGITYPQWNAFPSLWTGDGGLGERLASMSEALFKDHDAVIFIGTDSPQISSSILTQAVSLLQEKPNNHIVGPAIDGGFYLFASTSPVPRSVWEAIEYSVDTTLNDLITRLKEIGDDTLQLETEQDVDTLDDLKLLKETLSNRKPELLPAQVDVLNWLNSQEL